MGISFQFFGHSEVTTSQFCKVQMSRHRCKDLLDSVSKDPIQYLILVPLQDPLQDRIQAAPTIPNRLLRGPPPEDLQRQPIPTSPGLTIPSATPVSQYLPMSSKIWNEFSTICVLI